MVKRFKEYDKEFASYRGQLMPYELDDMHFDMEGAEYEEGWTHCVQQHTMQDVARAVYESSTASEWQKFRVSLKGMSTKEKLYRLHFRWMWAAQKYADDIVELKYEQIRIDNYIGALVRAGLLNRDLEVVK